MEANAIRYSVQSFLTPGNWKILFGNGRPLRKMMALSGGLGRRITMLFQLHGYDFIFIHREVTPIGPPIFEWILSRVLKKKIIYDFDDAIWLSDEVESKFIRFLKCRSKVSSICSWSYKVSCGNQYLADYAGRFNENTIVNPTTIDTDQRHNPGLFKTIRTDNKITIGWTGSHSTLKYIHEIEPALLRISSKFKNLKFMFIADRAPKLKLESYEFVSWNESSEIFDLSQFDIGIMPLPDDEWSKGKCGFKLLQYLALEIPAVASRVGVNPDIIDHGSNGYLATTTLSWTEALERLIMDKPLRELMGRSGRSKVQKHYSVDSNTSNFLSLFE